MTKDVIYIDVDDDITAIIDKIKASSGSLVALVPPKRTGVLQSSINLRLIDKMANESDKELFIVSNNKSLILLATAANIPVAKNLQSKPELAEITALKQDNEDDIIDGSNLAIGELDKTTPPELLAKTESIDEALATLDVGQNKPNRDNRSDHVPPSLKNKRTKVPNFNSFRKKLFISFFLGLVIAGTIVWALVFAPAATIIITAKTIPEPISNNLLLSETATTSFDTETIRVITKEYKKDQTLDFEATGQDNVGQKASGLLTIYNCDDTDGFTIAAGTKFISFSSGLVYTNIDEVVVPGMTGKASTCQSTAEYEGAGVKQTSVIGSAAGETYNILPDDYYIPGFSYVYVTGTSMSGGSTKIAKVVTEEDVLKAKQQLVNTTDEVAVNELTKKFSSDQFAISSSLNIQRLDAISSPAVSEEVTGLAKLSSPTIYKMYGINKSEVKTILDQQLEKVVSSKRNTKVHVDGLDQVKITNFEQTDKAMTVNLATTARIGPVIDQNDVKTFAKGKRYGEVQTTFEAIAGVESVDIVFSYPWVFSVPKDTNKINVEFKLDV